MNAFRVYLDPGHGHGDPGTVSPHTGEHEADLAFMLSSQVGAYLAYHRDIEVESTAYTLAERIKRQPKPPSRQDINAMRAHLANEWRADLLVSFHFNAAVKLLPADTPAKLLKDLLKVRTLDDGRHEVIDTAPRGSEILVPSEKLKHIGQVFADYLPTPRRGVKVNERLTLFRHATVPAVLLECMFLTNAIDAGWLRSNGVADLAHQIGIAIRLVAETMQEARP